MRVVTALAPGRTRTHVDAFAPYDNVSRCIYGLQPDDHNGRRLHRNTSVDLVPVTSLRRCYTTVNATPVPRTAAFQQLAATRPSRSVHRPATAAHRAPWVDVSFPESHYQAIYSPTLNNRTARLMPSAPATLSQHRPVSTACARPRIHRLSTPHTVSTASTRATPTYERAHRCSAPVLSNIGQRTCNTHKGQSQSAGVGAVSTHHRDR